MVRSSPLVVFGRSSNLTTGPFTTSGDTVQYYPKFTVPLRKELIAPSGSLAIDATEHGFGTVDIRVGTVESTSVVNRSYSTFIPDGIRINDTSFNLDIDYTISTTTPIFVYYKDVSTVPGQTWVEGPVSLAGMTTATHTIPASTHNLDNYNIIVQVQADDGTQQSLIVPDQVLILSNGTVQVTLTNDTSSTINYYVLLSAAPITQVSTGVVGANATGSVTISGLTKPWIFPGIYLEQALLNEQELVYPDSITYDDTTATATITFTNSSPTATNFTVFYEYGDVRSNQLCVTDVSATVDGTDTSPQLTIWGLDHSEIYATKENREGWANYIDSFRRSGERRILTGLGGNIFSARSYAEAGATYDYPLLYPSLSSRSTGNLILGPLLWDTGETPGRTRGYITGDSSGTHWASVTGVQFDQSNGWTKYTISIPNKQILDSTGAPTTLSAVISTTSNFEDYLQVQQMSWARHSGVFRIRQVQDSTNQIFIWVENPNNSSDFDDSGTGGEAGVFTDVFNWTGMAPYIAGDILSAELLTSSTCTVVSSSGSSTRADGLLDKLEVPAGVLFAASRISNIIPLRTPNPNSVSSVINLVRGDMLSYTEIDRLLRVQFINSDTDRTINISGDGTTATVTLSSGDTSYINEGQEVLIIQAGVYSGVQTITSIVSGTSFQFASTNTDSVVGATLHGNTMQVDEQLSWADTTNDANLFQCPERWIPAEAPDSAASLPPFTHVRYFDIDQYSDQPFIRSSMVVDNMYMSNYDDNQFKFDGSSLYRSGLIPWQPGLFLTQDTSPAAKIVTNLRSFAYSAIDTNLGRLEISQADVGAIPATTPVRLTGSLTEYTINSYTDDSTGSTPATHWYVLVDQALDASVASTGTVQEIGVYRYYFRLNAVDNNSNIIASAATGFQDHVIELSQNAAIRIKLVGLPNWDIYDFDKLEVQIYRTKQNQAAPFYLITTLPMDFNNTTGYLTFLDAFTDTDLTQLDVVNTALKGTELGTGWSDALRAKYVTSVNNKLVLGNIQDYPQLDISIVGDATLGASTLAGTTFLFRKDSNDTGTTTDMVNRATYEFRNGFSGDASSFSILTNQFQFHTSAPTGATTGDWIYLTYDTVATSGRDLSYCGWYQIASVSVNTVTVNLTGAAAAVNYPNKYCIASVTKNIPVMLGTDGSLGMVNGTVFDVFDSMRRLSMAINASMRQVDVSLTGMSTFIPWLVSRGGNDVVPAGRILIRQPRSSQTVPSVSPTFSGYSLFVNNIRRNSGDQIDSSTRVYPSRLIVSYQNYPEIFDNPTAILDTDSDSAIDINSADGQEITGMVPFFGSSAFTAAQQTAILVVFKSNSIYLVDLNQKAAGALAVQRLQTEGLGCTAPYSICATKNGIMFANESGMYCLRPTQAIEYIGRFMERNWLETVDLKRLDLVQGHHWGTGRMYKISVPLAANLQTNGYLENSDVFVYNHTGEDVININSMGYQTVGRGAWSRYTNHAATGWANLAPDAFFSSTNGRVFSVRQTGSVTDFRDDNEAIDMRADLRPNDFGNSGIRKILDAIIVHYRSPSTNNLGTSVSYTVDLTSEYIPTSVVVVNAQQSQDIVGQDIQSIRHNLDRRRGIYFNARLENSAIDESVEIAGVDYKIGGLTEKGIVQASQTTSKANT